MNYRLKMFSTVAAIICCIATAYAQVNSVQFGKNRVQHKKFKWSFYETDNFHTYYNEGGQELGKFAAQVAEEELPQIEGAIEDSLQRKASIVVYNDYNDYKSSNIGLDIDWQNVGGGTKLVNNKLVVYFSGDHKDLRRQIREGLAKTLTDNILFGDDIGEFASNQALLDLPKWLTDGYSAYIAENWNTKLDNDLKIELLGVEYKNFYQFAFKKPELAGHAFWHFLATKYKKENVTYFLYLARIYKNLNNASVKITQKKFKALLAEFMEVMTDRYYQDMRGRRNAPKGQISVIEEVNEKQDFIRFNANPNARNPTYAVVKYRKGKYSVFINENYGDIIPLISYGVRVKQGQIHPNYPILAWDGKGTRLLTVYWENGKIKMFIYDLLARYKSNRQEIKGFDQIIDASFMLDAKNIILSATKNGHSDLFIYNVESEKVTQLTNDVYDDLDPTFVSFPNRSGVIFSSNRPGVNAPNNDTVLPSRHQYNIFMVDVENQGAFKQITQLSNMQRGTARYPMQYNTNHFTFVSDEMGIANRYAGFFSTQRDGLDTLYFIGDEILRNPSPKEMDSTMANWNKQEPDSISYFQIYKDSTYTFPITNYQTNLLETRIAGDKGQVSEVRQEGDVKFLYKLKVDENTLKRRNVNPKPTEYAKLLIQEKRDAEGKAIVFKDTVVQKPKNVFQTEFDESNDSALILQNAQPVEAPKTPTLEKARHFPYRLKFEADNVMAGISNNILVNRYQAFANGYGPIQLNNNNDINYTFRVGVNELMEDLKVMAGIRLGTNLKDNDLMLTFQNYRKRLDWGLTLYRSTATNFPGFTKIAYDGFRSKLKTTLYQGNITYPFNEIKSLRFSAGVRFDRGITTPIFDVGGNVIPDPFGLAAPDSLSKRVLAKLEYVHDNTLNPALNIWKGLRYKFYVEGFMPVGKDAQKKTYTWNFGFDIRNYVEITRNFIWATRAAGDVSWGKQKIVYYLGGVDGWINPKYNVLPQPDPDNTYAFQSLAVNMRGFKQNIANGNNALVLNSELRLPVFTTIMNKPINNAFLRNFQLVQFIDLGTAWNGKYDKWERPSVSYLSGPIAVKIKAGGVGPFAGGYGFGARSTLLGYFLKFDASWQMNGVFKGKPQYYFALGTDF